jgi:hypothetical protein
MPRESSSRWEGNKIRIERPREWKNHVKDLRAMGWAAKSLKKTGDASRGIFIARRTKTNLNGFQC